MAIETNRFYEWDGLAESWISDEESFDSDFPSQPYDSGDSVAAWIIETVFDLNLNSSDSDIGSSLPGYDIKSRDPYQMIQLSLAVEMKDDHLYECYADGDGTVHFYSIGENSSDIGFDVLYSIDTQELSKKCDNVMVIGYDPPPKRYAGSEFDMFTFANNAHEFLNTNDPSYIANPDIEASVGAYPIYHIWGDILGPEQCNHYKQAYIEYGDPHFNQEGLMQELEVYDRNKFETLSFYVNKIGYPKFNQASTNIEFLNTTPRYMELTDDPSGPTYTNGIASFPGNPTMGKLQKRSWTYRTLYRSPYCTQEDEIDPDAGVMLPRSDDKKFLGVREVYIWGYRLHSIDLDLYMDDNKDIIAHPKGADFVVYLDTMLSEPFALTREQDYQVVKGPGNLSGDPNQYRIVFSCNVRPEIADAKFGGTVGIDTMPSANIRVSPNVILEVDDNGDLVERYDQVIEDYSTDTYRTGKLRDGVTPRSSEEVDEVLIYPIDEGQAGYVVEKIIVVYDWDNPCVAISDEENTCTYANVSEFSFSFYPMIMQDKPRPVAINGESLDPTEILPDYDASTVQDLGSTTYARAFAGLEQGDIKITLPFLYTDDDSIWESRECEDVSLFIKSLQGQVVESTTYVCSPDAEPVLGEVIDGRTINSIDYSYQDSSQYLISVQAGPVWQGLQGWDTAVYQNQTERLQLEGIVTDVFEDNGKASVKIEELGVMTCINGTNSVLEKGDRVAITIYNNPVAK